MSAKSSIQWTDKTWNPTTGCTRVSPGCDHCYAFQLHDQRYAAKRAGKAVSGAQYDKPFSQVQLLQQRLEEPLHWREPSRVFVDSMSDLFHEDVPDEYLADVFNTMAWCLPSSWRIDDAGKPVDMSPHHTFQILTKRPARMQAVLSSPDFTELMAKRGAMDVSAIWPLPNVWLGVSVEDQQRADERIPLLLDTPAAVRFISAEPLLGDIDIRVWVAPDGLTGSPLAHEQRYRDRSSRLDWVIVGGESGQHARHFDIAWARALRDQCVPSGIALFVKQLGAHPYDGIPRMGQPPTVVRLRDRHGAEMSEWPEDLRIREFPGAAA